MPLTDSAIERINIARIWLPFIHHCDMFCNLTEQLLLQTGDIKLNPGPFQMYKLICENFLENSNKGNRVISARLVEKPVERWIQLRKKLCRKCALENTETWGKSMRWTLDEEMQFHQKSHIKLASRTTAARKQANKLVKTAASGLPFVWQQELRALILLLKSL